MSTRLCLAITATLFATPVAANLTIHNCLISPNRAAELSADAPGRIAAVMADIGDTVQQGDTLAVLEDRIERASLAIAQNDAEDDSELVSTQRLKDLEMNRLERARQLGERGLVSDDALRERELAFVQREVEFLRSQARMRRAALQLDLAKAQLQAKSLRAPFSGVIIEKYLEVGEMASASTPVFQLVELDTLKVETIVTKQQYAAILRDAEAQVVLELAGTVEIDSASILFDPLIDPASGTLRIRLTLPNETGAIAAGQSCQVIFATQ